MKRPKRSEQQTVADWLAKGNKITVVPAGVSGEKEKGYGHMDCRNKKSK